VHKKTRERKRKQEEKRGEANEDLCDRRGTKERKHAMYTEERKEKREEKK